VNETGVFTRLRDETVLNVFPDKSDGVTDRREIKEGMSEKIDQVIEYEQAHTHTHTHTHTHLQRYLNTVNDRRMAH
jgi:hypothetical protein